MAGTLLLTGSHTNATWHRLVRIQLSLFVFFPLLVCRFSLFRSTSPRVLPPSFIFAFSQTLLTLFLPFPLYTDSLSLSSYHPWFPLFRQSRLVSKRRFGITKCKTFTCNQGRSIWPPTDQQARCDFSYTVTVDCTACPFKTVNSALLLSSLWGTDLVGSIYKYPQRSTGKFECWTLLLSKN